jgi:hypothetical protein
MRPKTDPSKLFAVPRPLVEPPARVPAKGGESAWSRDSERAPEASGIRACLPAEAPISQSPPRSLEELETFLSARLERLEISLGCDDAVALVEAHVVRAALAEAGAYADASSSGAYSCEAELAESLRGVYAWAFGALDAVFLGEYVRPLPKRILNDLHDHGSVASMRSLLDPSQALIEPILLGLARACIRLTRPRG